MNIELRNVKYSPSLSEETSAFTADIYINGKKSGYARNDGRGGDTLVNPYGGVNRDLFVECENWLETQPQVNIGTTNSPYLVDNCMESTVDSLFTRWLEQKDQKKFEKKMETCLIWGVPNADSYYILNFKRPLKDVPKIVVQSEIDKYKKTFKEGEVFLNTNLEGFIL